MGDWRKKQRGFGRRLIVSVPKRSVVEFQLVKTERFRLARKSLKYSVSVSTRSLISSVVL